MIRNEGVQSRLYLSQGEENIFIENCKLPVHHIDGIRFLFRQYKMNRLGVIINDPFSYGRNIQTILFLKAIRSLLHKPVLILCAEGADQQWVERFMTWTDLDDEVMIGTATPVIKKLIVINTMLNLPAYCSREWSIVIVDSDKNNQVLKFPFKADFKIWNTPINMKENLDTFSEIYKWLYPNEKFDKNYFIPNEENAVDVIDKSILLDSFMEDIVIRREDLNASFEKYQRDGCMPPPKSVSKKNKDATGTKIKRSKNKTDNAKVTEEVNKSSVTNVTEEGSKVTSEALAAALTRLLGETSKKCECTEDFSIQNYERRDNEDLNVEKESQCNVTNIDDSDNQSNVKLYYESDYSTEFAGNELEEMDTFVYGKDTIESQEHIVKEPAKAFYASSSSNDQDKPKNEPTTNEVTKNQNSWNICFSKKYLDEIPLPSEKLETDLKNNKETKMNLDELNKEISDLGSKEDNSEEVTNNMKGDELKLGIKKVSDEINVKLNEINQTSDSGIAIVNTEQIKNYLKNVDENEIKVKPDELSKQIGDSGIKNMNSDQVTSLKRNTDNIDDKMKEYEEKLTKKFKGSFLDRLF